MTLLDDLARAAPFTQSAPAAPGFQPFQFLMPPAVPDAPAAQPPTAAPTAAPPAVTTTPPFSTVPPLPQLAQQQQQAGQPSGVVLPPEALSPQPMLPQSRQFRPRPATTGAAQPAPPPPEAKPPAKPPPERYIRTFPRKPNSWGTDDAVMEGSRRFPNADSPYMPQPHEYASVLDEAGGFLRQWGSGFTGMMALAMGMYSNGYQKAFKARQLETARLNLINFQRAAKETVFRQQQESREYAEAFAAYGPREDEKGKFIPGDADAMDHAIRSIARKYNDQNLVRVLETKGLSAVERVIAANDAHSQDIAKVLKQAEGRQRLENSRLLGIKRQLDIDKARRTAGEQWHEADPYRLRPGGVAPAPKEMGLESGWPAPPEGSEKADPGLFSTPKTDAEGKTDTEGRTEEQEEPAAAETEDTTAGTPEETAEATPETETPAKTAETAGAPAAAKTAEAPKAPTARPIQLAQAATGVATDAPSPAETAGHGAGAAAAGGGEPEPEPLIAKPVRTTREPPPEPGAPAVGAAPAQQRPQPRPGEGTAGTAWEPTPSNTARVALSRKDPVTGRPDPFDPGQIDELAQHIVNGTMQQKDWNTVPKPVRPYIRSRATEIEIDMDRIRRDDSLKGQAVYDALEKVNPEFVGTLRAYIDGTAPVPASAWKDPRYLYRTVGLGAKVDPSFNQGNFAIRQRTKQSYASGPDARNVTSIATLHYHGEEMLRIIDELDRLHPNWPQVMLGSTRIGEVIGSYLPSIKPTPRMQELFQELKVAQETVATEAARAKSGAAPHVSAMNREIDSMDFQKYTSRGVRAAVQKNVQLAEDRMKILTQRYDTVMGPRNSATDPLGKLLHNYSQGILQTPGWRQGQAYGDPAGDELGNYANHGDPRIVQEADRMITGTRGPRTGAPAQGGEVDFRDFFGVQ